MLTDIEKQLSKQDPVLSKIIEQIPRPEPVTTGNVFHDLMSCVIEQQIHYRSTKKIFEKLLLKANLQELTPDNFPEFEMKALPGIKLSIAKYETITRILEFWESKEVDWQLLDDNEVRKEFLTIKGVGKWTVDMILLYTLQRSNIFPYDDFHLKQVIVSLYGLNPEVKLKARMLEIAGEWGQQKSLAVRYLLDWKRLQKGLSSSNSV